MRQLSLGVIGMGMIGRVHVERIGYVPDARLAAVSDVNPDVQDRVNELGAHYYRDYEDMLREERLDGVVIAVPNNLHLDVGSRCAKDGVHLLVEKPIAANLLEADQLIECAHKHGVSLLVGHHRRFNAAINAVRDVIRAGRIGRLVGVNVLWTMYKPDDYFNATWRKVKGGGPILINLIHEIDNLRYMCGRIERVYAEVSNQARGFEVEDTASLSLKCESGALISIFLSDCVPSLWAYEATTGENPFFHHRVESCYHIFGTQASLTFPDLRLISYGSPEKRGWQHPVSVETLSVSRVDPYLEQLKHFCKVIRGEEVPRTTGEDARITLHVTLAACESHETAQPIRLH